MKIANTLIYDMYGTSIYPQANFKVNISIKYKVMDHVVTDLLWSVSHLESVNLENLISSLTSYIELYFV